MDKIEFLDEIRRIFAMNTVVDMPSDEQNEKLFFLTEIMLEVNSYMNLTAITDMTGIVLKHYVDSLTVSRYIPENSTVIDVGCGAGFPSLPLAVCRPDLEITAIDSTAKRIRYVADTAKKLELSNLTAMTARAEELATKADFRDSFDVYVARAVADLQILSELCLPFVRVGGKFISMKASKGDEELDKSQNAIRTCGGSDSSLNSFDITADSLSFEKRRIIVVDKTKPTPSGYPRNFGRIQKKPL